ncbi:prolyl oligopeptidase family serine peptidase [Phenylobacterium sp.]|uniref:prolyl oligopeptidase family serine peptidase n=1 Tax=Phenylobacterium sp. TaxID=1871053 RepID=UPI002DF3B1AF|nr:prolyl oligopeptidase family serine peptidase [Phenylobacterium sp.]
MPLIDRRRLMLTAAAVGLAPLAARAAVSAPPAPVARVAVVKDTYFGETLSDPYRWMENDKDPDWLPFLRAQNAHARAYLDAIPGRDRLLSRIQQLSGDTALTSKVQRAGGRLFFQQRPAGADNYKLFVREGGHDRVLVDPTTLSAGGGHISLDWWEASPDGAHVVYGLSPNGSEDSVAHIMVVADGHDLAETIANTEGAQPSWLDDGTGFFYNQLTGKVATPERYLDSQARFHRLGTDPASDPILMKRGLDPAVAYDKIQGPTIFTFEGSPFAVLTLTDVRREFRALIAPLREVLGGHARWTQVAGFDDEVTDVVIDGDQLYLLANRGTPRGRIVRTAAAQPSLASATLVVPQGPQVIQSLGRARDGFYLNIMDGGVSRLRRLTRDGHVSEIALPFDGTIGAVFTTPSEDGALMTYTGWLTPAGIWSANPAGQVADTGLTPRPAIDTSPYETVRGFAVAKDGVRIPYTLIYRKGLKRDGKTPAWISAYGSYGSSAYTPAFAGKTLALIDAGFIVGYANVRGGGEYGREWHKAGQLMNKPNTWRDLIAVCEHICHEGYTAPARLAIGGRSAGGITVGRALTERPDLFAAVIDGVGWSNPLRYVAEQDGYGEEPEWGAIAEKSGFEALKLIDSYQAVKDGTPYPAVLLTTGVTDPRVAPFHVGKMTARLQRATSSGKPILLRVDFDAGHGIGSTRGQQDREAVDTYAFLLWRTGVAGYQPV